MSIDDELREPQTVTEGDRAVSPKLRSDHALLENRKAWVSVKMRSPKLK
jgi:hypothetical protein